MGEFRYGVGIALIVMARVGLAMLGLRKLRRLDLADKLQSKGVTEVGGA
jgi:hypothetical protein